MYWEYKLDEKAKTATLVFSKEFPMYQAYVAGNAYRMENGNTIAAFGSQGYVENLMNLVGLHFHTGKEG